MCLAIINRYRPVLFNRWSRRNGQTIPASTIERVAILVLVLQQIELGGADPFDAGEAKGVGDATRINGIGSRDPRIRSARL